MGMCLLNGWGFEHVQAATIQDIPTTIIVTNKNLCVREATRPSRSTSATDQSELGHKLIAPRDLTMSLLKGIGW
jgi:hypothetical protein